MSIYAQLKNQKGLNTSPRTAPLDTINQLLENVSGVGINDAANKFTDEELSLIDKLDQLNSEELIVLSTAENKALPALQVKITYMKSLDRRNDEYELLQSQCERIQAQITGLPTTQAQIIGLAIERGETHKIGMLIAEGAQLDHVDAEAEGKTPLQRAIAIGDHDTAKLLIASGANIENLTLPIQINLKNAYDSSKFVSEILRTPHNTDELNVLITAKIEYYEKEFQKASLAQDIAALKLRIETDALVIAGHLVRETDPEKRAQLTTLQEGYKQITKMSELYVGVALNSDYVETGTKMAGFSLSAQVRTKDGKLHQIKSSNTEKRHGGIRFRRLLGLNANASDMTSEFVGSQFAELLSHRYQAAHPDLPSIAPKVSLVYDDRIKGRSDTGFRIESEYMSQGEENNHLVKGTLDELLAMKVAYDNTILTERHAVFTTEEQRGRTQTLPIGTKFKIKTKTGQVIEITLSEEQLLEQLKLSMLLGDHDINPGNMFVTVNTVTGIATIGRIDFGHTGNDLITKWSASKGPNYSSKTRGPTLDALNRRQLSGFRGTTLGGSVTKFLRDYEGLIPSLKFASILRASIFSEEDLEQTVNKTKNQFLALIHQAQAANDPLVQEKLLESLRTMYANIGGTEPITADNAEAVLQHCLVGFKKFLVDNQKEQESVANLMEVQSLIDQIAKGEIPAAQAMTRIQEIYRSDERYLKDKTPSDPIDWVSVGANDKPKERNLTEQIEYRAKQLKQAGVSINDPNVQAVKDAIQAVKDAPQIAAPVNYREYLATYHALIKAIQKGDLDGIEAIGNLDTYKEQKDDIGLTPLQYAILNENLQVYAALQLSPDDRVKMLAYLPRISINQIYDLIYAGTVVTPFITKLSESEITTSQQTERNTDIFTNNLVKFAASLEDPANIKFILSTIKPVELPHFLTIALESSAANGRVATTEALLASVILLSDEQQLELFKATVRKAVATNNPAFVLSIINKGADKAPLIKEALKEAAKTGKAAVVTKLLEQPEIVTLTISEIAQQRQAEFHKAMKDAVIYNRKGQIVGNRLTLAKFQELRSQLQTITQKTTLHDPQVIQDSISQAAKNGHVDVVAELLKLTTKTETAPDFYNSGLMEAVKAGHIDVVKLLLPQVIVKYKDNIPALIPILKDIITEATKNGRTEIIELAINHVHPDLDVPKNLKINTALGNGGFLTQILESAIDNRHPNVVKFIVNKIVNSPSFSGNLDAPHNNVLNNALKKATHPKLLQAIIDGGADVCMPGIKSNLVARSKAIDADTYKIDNSRNLAVNWLKLLAKNNKIELNSSTTIEQLVEGQKIADEHIPLLTAALACHQEESPVKNTIMSVVKGTGAALVACPLALVATVARRDTSYLVNTARYAAHQFTQAFKGIAPDLTVDFATQLKGHGPSLFSPGRHKEHRKNLKADQEGLTEVKENVQMQKDAAKLLLQRLAKDQGLKITRKTKIGDKKGELDLSHIDEKHRALLKSALHDIYNKKQPDGSSTLRVFSNTIPSTLLKLYYAVTWIVPKYNPILNKIRKVEKSTLYLECSSELVDKLLKGQFNQLEVKQKALPLNPRLIRSLLAKGTEAQIVQFFSSLPNEKKAVILKHILESNPKFIVKIPVANLVEEIYKTIDDRTALKKQLAGLLLEGSAEQISALVSHCGKNSKLNELAQEIAQLEKLSIIPLSSFKAFHLENTVQQLQEEAAKFTQEANKLRAESLLHRQDIATKPQAEQQVLESRAAAKNKKATELEAKAAAKQQAADSIKTEAVGYTKEFFKLVETYLPEEEWGRLQNAIITAKEKAPAPAPKSKLAQDIANQQNTQKVIASDDRTRDAALIESFPASALQGLARQGDFMYLVTEYATTNHSENLEGEDLLKHINATKPAVIHELFKKTMEVRQEVMSLDLTSVRQQTKAEQTAHKISEPTVAKQIIFRPEKMEEEHAQSTVHARASSRSGVDAYLPASSIIPGIVAIPMNEARTDRPITTRAAKIAKIIDQAF